MSEQCSGSCSQCGDNCPSKQDPSAFLKPVNENSHVGKVIGVVSGKGGVGKSLVTSLLAVTMRRRGHSVAVLDADITGPSIPQAFGVHDKCYQSSFGIEPAVSSTGVEIMSINLLLENETEPVIWRGPVIAGVITQFWTDVHWGDVDYMFVDMPPGTGDAPLTVFQSLPVDGVVVVATPQELVGMIVAKAVKMARRMSKKVLGLVENMSYFKCPDCGGEHQVFGPSRAAQTAEEYLIPRVAKLPIDPALANLVDQGTVEDFSGTWLDDLADDIEKL